MRLKEWLREDNKGFSLIEVVLAVAILALVTLPIMNYFTYSSQQTFEGRDKQTANMVAESALEELNSYNNYEQIEKLDEDGGVWTIDDSDPTVTKMSRVTSNNGRDYDVTATIQYDTYNKETKTIVASGTGDEIDSEFNDYEIPQPSEVYSSENVVASEDDQIDGALSEFYLREDARVPKSIIQNQMDRTICIDVSYATTDHSLYRVEVYYRYKYNGDSVKAHLCDSEIEVDKLENIFVFYNLHKDGVINEEIDVTFGTDIGDDDIKQFKIFFARQTSDTIVPDVSYKLSLVSTDARAKLAQYFTNVELTDFALAKEDDGTPIDFVKKEKKKRIGRIEVNVAEDGDSEVLATLSTTKAE